MELNAVNPIECSRTISEEMEIDFEEVEELKVSSFYSTIISRIQVGASSIPP